AVDSKQLRNRGLAQPLIEIVSQYHASLQSDQVRLRREGEGAKCTISRESAYAAPHGLPATIPVPSGTLSSARSGKLSTAANRTRVRAPTPGPRGRPRAAHCSPAASPSDR